MLDKVMGWIQFVNVKLVDSAALFIITDGHFKLDAALHQECDSVLPPLFDHGVAGCCELDGGVVDVRSYLLEWLLVSPFICVCEAGSVFEPVDGAFKSGLRTEGAD